MFRNGFVNGANRLQIRRLLHRSINGKAYIGRFSQKSKRGVATTVGFGCSVAIATAFGLAYGDSEETAVETNISFENKIKPKSSVNQQGLQAIEKSLLQLEQVKEETGSPGLVCAVSIDGQVVWSTGLGFSDVENGVKCNSGTLMRIASISKALTSIAIGKLLQEQKIDLDIPVQKYVDYFPDKEFGNEKVTITTRQLMSHTSGIRHYEKTLKKDADVTEEKETNEGDKIKKQPELIGTEIKRKGEFFSTDNYETIKDALRLFQDDPLLKKPGTDYLYSTHAWTLISAVIENASSMDYVSHMKQVCYDLGLDNTLVELNDPITYNRSRYYTRDKKGRLTNCPYVDNSYKWAGGGFLSNVDDLVKIGNVMLCCYQSDNNQGYLSKHIVDQLWTPTSITIGKVSKKFKEMGYGLGWVVQPESAKYGCGRKTDFAAMHSGSAIGASSILLIIPRKLSNGFENKEIRHAEQSNAENNGENNADNNGYRNKAVDKPRGITVAIIVNMQEVSLTNTAFKIARNFQEILTQEL